MHPAMTAILAAQQHSELDQLAARRAVTTAHLAAGRDRSRPRPADVTRRLTSLTGSAAALLGRLQRLAPPRRTPQACCA